MVLISSNIFAYNYILLSWHNFFLAKALIILLTRNRSVTDWGMTTRIMEWKFLKNPIL
jgi:hypothetical protein